MENTKSTRQVAGTGETETTLVLLAYGRHDRGNLFPKARRQLENLLPRVRRIVGEFESGKCLVFHDGTKQAEETVWRMEFPTGANQGERYFLDSPMGAGPDDFEMYKAYRLVQDAGIPIVILVTNHVYVRKFSSYYLTKIGKDAVLPQICPGDGVVIEHDGTLHPLVSHD
jgi:hypothetical protein